MKAFYTGAAVAAFVSAMFIVAAITATTSRAQSYGGYANSGFGMSRTFSQCRQSLDPGKPIVCGRKSAEKARPVARKKR
jgi:hypothetical protein